ncbi:MAG: transcriptional repressor NrdR [Clostridia bacterium]|nr:transcriptional repressor NrdR [Clostridia bacterium]
MKCPFCDFLESKVIDSRPTDEGGTIRRRRECMECGKRFTTYEKVETSPIMVVKKDKSRQLFDRQKILNGLLSACEKTTMSVDDMENIATSIETSLQNSLCREVSSERIGEMVMEHLRSVNQVAYVRFASVYREFKDIDTFMSELNKLLRDK